MKMWVVVLVVSAADLVGVVRLSPTVLPADAAFVLRVFSAAIFGDVR